ncbi:unnamed protein product [Periconia digitata]|uniref:Uncharacterized protein n=1 Tax=Periconia digitata TaxID=1303443 RepID=A0A9W4UT94_9PLEO|nr:unnamed protein product [Periconia digitata]
MEMMYTGNKRFDRVMRLLDELQEIVGWYMDVTRTGICARTQQAEYANKERAVHEGMKSLYETSKLLANGRDILHI